MGSKITILTATMTGTAELVAEEVRDWLAAAGMAVTIRTMDGLGTDAFAEGGLFLVCSSTYGQGDVPDNAQAFFAALEQDRPDLSAVRFGVIALGDRTYGETFCRGGRRFDALLRELGARRIGEVLLHDASGGTMPEEAALEWLEGWIRLLPSARDEAA